jgi:peptide/nickel transport system ATP-binding protein
MLDKAVASSRRARSAEVERRLDEVGIDAHVARRLPFQLSGGMAQRVALAAALARDPKLLIADEPSTALDVTTQAEILKLLRQIQRQRRMSLILITHDLRLAFSTSDRIYVLYAGSLLEVGDARAVEREPFHPYTLGLLLSEPPAQRRVRALLAIRGAVPAAADVAGMCSFAPRCDWARDACRAGDPPLAAQPDGRRTACIRWPAIRDELRAVRRSALAEVGSVTLVPSASVPCRVRVTDLVKVFGAEGGRAVHALKGVSLHVHAGESVGLVGESGSGKTTLGRCVVGLETPTAGRIAIDEVETSNFAALSARERAKVRMTVQMVFQDPYATLNPKHSVGRCIAEALAVAEDQAPRDGVVALLREVGLPESYALRRPATLSGGEQQRVAIARALAVRPKLVVCDEPVSALDVSVQAQILNLLKRIQEERGISYLFISHDLAVVRQMVDRVCVLYLGEIVEDGATEDVMSRPQHPYTRRLIDSIPRVS